MKIKSITISALILLLLSIELAIAQGIDSTENISNTARSGDSSSLSGVPSRHDSTSVSKKVVPDSIRIRRDSVQTFLLTTRKTRASHFLNSDATTDQNPRLFPTSSMFKADGMAISELLESSALVVPVQLSLGSILNRSLYYGNSAPINPVMKDGHLLKVYADAYRGTDDLFSPAVADLTLDSDGSIVYASQPASVVTPEALAYWENGVFGEKSLGLRFTRPFSRYLLANIFSNYRYFEERLFSHESNDVHAFYRSLYADTLKTVNKGYHPLVNESQMGIQLHWDAHGKTVWDGAFVYEDFQHQVALDRPYQNNMPTNSFALLSQYRTTMEGYYSYLLSNAFTLKLDSKYTNEPIVKKTPVDTERTTVRNDAELQRIELAGEVSFNRGSDSVYLSNTFTNHEYETFTNSELKVLSAHPQIGYRKSHSDQNISYNVNAALGYAYRADNSDNDAAITWLATADFAFKNQIARIFVRKDLIPLQFPYNFSPANIFAIDNYVLGGTDLTLNRGRTSLTLGYQFTNGIDSVSVLNSWTGGTPPYSQPQHTVIVSPSVKNVGIISFSNRTLLSDTKPQIKTSTNLSLELRPKSIAQVVNLVLNLDYWSQRDSISYGDSYLSSNALWNLGLTTNVHIKHFRLFYKVDNLLNRTFAYVPGYPSAGITFRWGINWFIQR